MTIIFGNADTDQVLIRSNINTNDDKVSVYIQQTDFENIEAKDAKRVLKSIIKQATEALTHLD